MQNEDRMVNFGATCGESGQEIKGVRYYAAYEVSETVKEINLSQEAFVEPTEYDILPQVYFRLTKPLKADAKLPMIDLSKLFNKDENFKFEIHTTADKQHFTNK